MRLLSWLATTVILLLAAYTFFLVPVGRMTLWQHAQAIAATPPARRLAEDVRQTIEAKLVEARVSSPPPPGDPPGPAPAGGRTP